MYLVKLVSTLLFVAHGLLKSGQIVLLGIFMKLLITYQCSLKKSV